jgi:hypothetical protein
VELPEKQDLAASETSEVQNDTAERPSTTVSSRAVAVMFLRHGAD